MSADSRHLLSRFREIYQNRHRLGRQWRAEGRKLFGVMYCQVPEELFQAAGLVPVQLTEGDNPQGYGLGRPHFEDFFCDFLVSCLGEALAGEYDYLDGIAIPDICESIRSFAGLWELHVAIPLFWLPCPGEASEGSRRFFRGELQKLKERLEQSSGVTITPERLGAAIQLYDENRSLLRELGGRRGGGSPPLSEREFVDVLLAGMVMAKVEHNRMLRELLAALPREGARRKGTRLFLSWFNFEECLEPPLDILGMVEQLGGDVVANDLAFGPRFYWEPAAPRGDPMEALLERYLGNVPVPYRFPTPRRIEMLLNAARQGRAQGAVFIIPKYCTVHLWEQPLVERAFRAAGIPTLTLESAESTPALPVRNRLEAFVEMLPAAD